MSRIAYRTRELQLAHPDRGFAKTERQSWEEDPAWQGLRELAEKSLATYDWGESFVALNLITKPAAMKCCGNSAIPRAVSAILLLAMLVDNQLRDSDRSRRWSAALVEFTSDRETNKAAIRDWIDAWMPLSRTAITAYCDALPESDGAAAAAMPRSSSIIAGLVWPIDSHAREGAAWGGPYHGQR